jgi:hypothetical protein
MSERSILKGIGEALLGRKGPRTGTPPLTTIEHRCPECQNALDPSWTQCPYCEARKKAGDKTARPPESVAKVPPSASSSRRATRADEPAAVAAAPDAGASVPPGRGHTVVDAQPGGPPGAARAGGGGRKLTGVVTSFTWTRLGQLFEVRDGRNYVGSGDVSSENNRRCDVHVPDDHLMSAAHFLILCQSGKYIISDNLSTNGTWVNDRQIDTRGEELPDNALIKAGATVFTFQKIRAPLAGATTSAAEPSPDEDKDDPRPQRPGREDTVI